MVPDAQEWAGTPALRWGIAILVAALVAALCATYFSANVEASYADDLYLQIAD